MKALPVALRVPATTANLGPGFDSFGLALGLHLTARAVPRGELRVATTGEGADELPSDDTNLVWRGVVALCEHAGVAPPDVSLEVDNDVPLERGLGSSSAAAVAGIGLARALLELPVGDLDLVRIAAELEGHPDNAAPAVLGGLTVCATTDDGRLVVRRAQPAPSLRPVVFVPTRRQSTSEARALLPDALPRADAATQSARAGHVLGALLGAWPVDVALSGDLLHEPPRLAAMPATAALLADLRARGIHAWLSGAGPAVCAAVTHDDDLPDATDFDLRDLHWDLSGLTPLFV